MNILERFQVHLQSQGYAKFKSEGIKSCYQQIVNMDLSLDSLMKKFDQDGSGTIDFEVNLLKERV